MRRFGRLSRAIGLSLLVVGVAVGSLGLPADIAGAQDGPQFGDWGPGKPPPDQEGFDTATPSSPGSRESGQGESYGAAPRAAAPAAPAAAPAPGSYGGCSYDLRGTWWNDGRYTSGGSGSYSSRVTVRQYRSWIQADQDDGTSYYGRCYGNRLQFDVYSGWTFAGTQNGTISSTGTSWGGSSWNSPWGRERGGWDYSTEAAAAPAAAPAPGTSGGRASFTWSTWYGSGRETWSR
jgi:hypothetical protein